MYTATPHIGHGFDGVSLARALQWKPDIVVAQGTSTDPGPFYLGEGTSYMQSLEVKSDMRELIVQCKRARIPFIVSLGGSGTDSALTRELGIVDAIAREECLDLKLAVISGEVDKSWLVDRLAAGARARRLVETPFLEPDLSAATVNGCARIVAQMGPEPIIEALKTPGIDGVVTGRALDVGLFVALPLQRGFSPHEAMHFATIMHDGALACIPGSGSDGLFGTLATDHFVISTPNPERRCTPVSVAAMSFYERPNPHFEAMPGGSLDVSAAVYEAIDDRSVRVHGARWTAAPYTVKLEGASMQGYRAICIGGTCDPLFIESLDDILAASQERVGALVDRHQSQSCWQLAFRAYGKNALQRTPASDALPPEVGILIDVLADDPELAAAVCSIGRSVLLHQGYPGRKTTAGNLAIPFSPVEVMVGPSYRYSIWHALELNNPVEPFPTELTSFPREAVN